MNIETASWKKYETSVLEGLKAYYPNAEIKSNVKITGIISRVSRQVDILVEIPVLGKRIRIVVECKLYKKKIDVKDVEAFIGMIQDIGAHSGILISQEGYSQGAINRAYYNPQDIELDILSVKDLKVMQSELGIPFHGKNGVVLRAPFGWVVDAKQRGAGYPASLYQRGLDLEGAKKNMEWAYVNFWNRNDKVNSLDQLLKHQEEYTRKDHPNVVVKYLDTTKRKDARTCIRLFEIDSYPCLEYTGFVEFKEFILFCVMFTPKELEKRNLRKLDYILSNVLPLKVKVPETWSR